MVKKYVLDQSLSMYSPEDLVIVPNIPIFSGAARMRVETEVVKWSFLSALEMFQSEMFLTLRLEEILWGYEEPLVSGASMVLPEAEIKVPGHFGLLAGRNLTSDGRYTVWGGAGEGGTNELGEVSAWNEKGDIVLRTLL